MPRWPKSDKDARYWQRLRFRRRANCFRSLGTWLPNINNDYSRWVPGRHAAKAKAMKEFVHG